MTHLVLASATFGQVIVTITLVMVSLLLIGLILLQKNRGSGLSGAFGGVGGHTAFGTKTGDFLTWVTVGLAAFFLLLSVVANYVFDKQTVAAETIQSTPVSPIESATPAKPSPQVKVITPEQLKTQSGPVKITTTPGGAATPTRPPTPVTPPAATPPAPTPTSQPSH